MTRYEVRSSLHENVSNSKTGDFEKREDAERDLEAVSWIRPDMSFRIVEVTA